VRSGRKLLSARRLDDVPASVRIGSPYDAPDSLVYRVLHPQTNYGVIYRVAFAPAMKQGEQPAQGALPALPVEGMPTSPILRFGGLCPQSGSPIQGTSSMSLNGTLRADS
jgi:hypothetical protein